jgi:opacity protein-like surface antigen
MNSFAKWMMLVLLTCSSAAAWAQVTNLAGLKQSEFHGVKVGGYFDTEWKSSSAENTFTAHRMVLFTTASPHPSILFNTEVEFEYGGAINSLGDKGEVKIEQAWVDYRLSEQAVLRGGVVLVPFGRLNILHDSNIRQSTNRPILTKYIIPTTWMDTGIGVHGTIDSGDWEFTYDAYMLNGLIATPSTTTGIRNARPNFKADNNKQKAFAGRIGILPSIKTEMGLSFYQDKMTSTTQERTLHMYGFDFLHKEGIFEVAGEWALSKITDDTVSPQQDGYFLEARVRWMPDWIKGIIGATQFDSPSMTWFTRVGQVDLNRGGTTAKTQSQTTYGVNYRPIESLAFKLEYELNRGELAEANIDAIYGSVAFGF